MYVTTKKLYICHAHRAGYGSNPQTTCLLQHRPFHTTGRKGYAACREVIAPSRRPLSAVTLFAGVG